MMTQLIKGETRVIKSLPVLGSKWNGKPQQFLDTQAGSMWQVMPTLTEAELMIQRALLQPVKPSVVEVFDLVWRLDRQTDQLIDEIKTFDKVGVGHAEA